MNFNSLRDAYREEVIRTRRAFHAAPELSGHEWNTAERIRAILTGAGIPWEPCGKELPGTLVTIDGVGAGKTILLRADIDALPIEEKNDVPYKSGTKGVMHACGHDCHISMLLTAVMIANSIRDEIPGTIKFIFQPAEEVALGALDMMADGVLDGVDGMFGMHVWSELPAGQVSLEAGGRMAATDQFEITITGKSGHAALPHKCVDATPCMAATIMDLQTVVSRQVNPVSPLVLTVGKVTSGTRWNVISGSAKIEGTVRSLDSESRDMAEESVKRIAANTAASYRCTAEVKYDRLCDNVYNDPEITAFGREAAKTILGPDALPNTPPTMGGEDFGFYCSKVKAAFALFGVGNAACNACYPQHSDHYTVDESTLVKGALLSVQTALNFLNANK